MEILRRIRRFKSFKILNRIVPTFLGGGTTGEGVYKERKKEDLVFTDSQEHLDFNFK